MISKLDVRLPAEGGLELGAWLFLPEGSMACPAVTMAHGFAGTKEHGIGRFAKAFAEAIVVVLAHDHRNSGMSDGETRDASSPLEPAAHWKVSYDRAIALAWKETTTLPRSSEHRLTLFLISARRRAIARLHGSDANGN